VDNVYDKWNNIKKKTEKTHRKLGIKPRDIFWFKVGKTLVMRCMVKVKSLFVL
jgi:hypothetical protein